RPTVQPGVASKFAAAAGHIRTVAGGGGAHVAGMVALGRDGQELSDAGLDHSREGCGAGGCLMPAPPLAVLGVGLVSGVGLTAEEGCAAIRCGINNFQETRFIGGNGEWLVGSAVEL